MIKQRKFKHSLGLLSPAFKTYCKSFSKSLTRKAYTIMVAFALGMSNVMLNQTRMIHDTKPKTEQQQTIPDADD